MLEAIAATALTLVISWTNSKAVPPEFTVKILFADKLGKVKLNVFDVVAAALGENFKSLSTC